ncbi:MAG: DUF2064 domain-containing protein [Proteobacteria bacterium]|nr:DUF2064 domain-containing protein [Pseudomonadota bacterium]
MNPSGALVIFVKTPGLSPVKSRLAQEVGQKLSREFYERSVRATAAVAREAQSRYPGLAVYWAIAEVEGLAAPMWAGFPKLYQGEGSLGHRLSHVYQHILRRHDFACFMGADSPHLEVSKLIHGIRETGRWLRKKFVMGEADDGGFYFFGGSIPVPETDWTSVPYSVSQTAQELTGRLELIAPVCRIERSFDIDLLDDLKHYLDQQLLGLELLPEQWDLIQWSQVVCKDR